MSRGGGRMPGEVIAAVLIHLSKEHGIMQAAIAPRGDARTFLTHFVGSGLDDGRYVVEKMRPARDEIIIATEVKLRRCGVQFWGWRAMGIFADRRQHG